MAGRRDCRVRESFEALLGGVRHAIIAIALLATSTAYACSCGLIPDSVSAARTADAVFSGRIERIQSRRSTFGPDLAVTFAVERSWKGKVTPSEIVATAGATASCGFPFEKGRTYLVFAARLRNGSLMTSLCSRTGLLSHSIKDAAAFGEGQAVARNPAVPLGTS